MAADQLPSRVREFAQYLDGLLARLDPSGGWCAVFWQRDPEGMRACLDGHEMPPWDVVEALLQDLAGQYGPGGAGPETERAWSLHAAALTAYDARPGGRDALGDRLDVMLREQRYAAERQADLSRLLASAATREQADALRIDLAWAHDDHERARARCAELRGRMAHLDRRDRGAAAFFEGRGVAAGPGGVPGARSEGEPVHAPGEFGSGLGAGTGRGGAASGRPEGARGGAASEASAAAAGVRGQEASGAAGGLRGGEASGAAAAVSGGGAPTSAPHGGAGPSRPADVFGGARPAAGAPAFGAGAVADGLCASGGGAAEGGAGVFGGGGAAGGVGVFGDGAADSGAGAFGDGAAEGGVRAQGGDAAEGGVRAHGGDAADGGVRVYGDGRSAAGASPRARRAPGGPSVPGTPAEPWHPAQQQPASGTVGGAGRHDTRHAAAGPEPERDAHEHPADRAVPPEAGGAPTPFPAPEPPAPQQPTPKQRKRRRGSARFAGMDEEEAAPVVVPPAAVPTLPDPAPVTGRTRRGARFAGAAEEAAVQHVEPRGEAGGAADRTEVARTVEALARLRTEGRSGEAHALLVELTSSAPARFPLLAGELERAGLGADWQTLLWEAAALPAGRLVAAADALGAAGRVGDGQQILRQGVARPPVEVGEAVLSLVAEGRHREVRALLDAYVRARTPEEAARSAEPGPGRLVPLLLEAAQGVSDERRWDLVHALRVAGFPG
ncbi:hypothetical protein OG873_07065 [Streptomyces violaceus]|uniref:hypothetical protein n=1 Tax=Streptomyces violaceus TaxID=1936 RepID=UPI002E28BC1B|nr:hypothetical protein [Streptomyces violaceus]